MGGVLISYASIADLKAVLNIEDTDDDTPLQLALDAASSAIDAHCNRTFVAAGSATARTFSADDRCRVTVDDIYTTTGLVVSNGNVALPAAVAYVSDGYELGPVNAAAKGRPWTFLRHTAGAFSNITNAIVVTAKWGYAATVPVAVEQACMLQASRIFSRRLSPFGIAGSPDLGSEVRLLARVDADVAVLLRSLVRGWVR
ncbi:MAG TPA: head-tail connector protein [Acidimicrobiales bacterium]